MAEKVAPAKAPVTEKNIEKVSGIKMNNIPKGKTEEEIVEFLEKHTKFDKDNLKIEMAESGRENITVRVTRGIEIDDMLITVEKINFRVTREQFLKPQSIQK